MWSKKKRKRMAPECKKWSAWSVSTKRQVQTDNPLRHPNTLGGQRSRADIYLYFHISTERRSLCYELTDDATRVHSAPCGKGCVNWWECDHLPPPTLHSHHEPEYKLSGIEARGKTVTCPSKSLRRFTFYFQPEAMWIRKVTCVFARQFPWVIQCGCVTDTHC